METLKLVRAVLLALVVLLSLGALTAAAQGPVAYLDNQSHTVPANGSVLYRFDYAINNDTGEHPITTMTLVNGTNSGLGFQVWTLDNVKLAQRSDATSTTDNIPVGRGTPQAVDCDTGEIEGSGGCQSADLIWRGALGGTGTYYVLVTNGNSSPADFLLKVEGNGVSLGQRPAVASTAPAGAPGLTVTTDDPNKAAAMDGQRHTIAANSATWYRFDYAINNDTGERPVKTIALVNGNHSGATFEVWTADALNGGWWNNTPIGRGTPYSMDCDTGERTGGGQCQSADLTWSGTFGTSGTYYVRVVNDNNAATDVVLTIQ